MTHHMQSRVVFTDLSEVFEALNIERDSPKNIRRTFSRFVELSQKLTSAMRKDYSQLKHESWNASDFSSWNPITELLKYLRNEDQHGHQISISVHERRFYPMPSNFPYPTNIEPGQLWVSEGTWNLNDQLLNEVPEGITCYAIDPTTFLPTDHEILPVRIERFYILQAQSEEAINKLQAAGTADIHIIAQQAFTIFSDYCDFFCAKTRD